jgi:hypothetical protein
VKLLTDQASGDYAYYSDNGEHRYLLHRHLVREKGLLIPHPKKFVVFGMLNPSTASPWLNDPTVTRCCSFARTWHVTDLIVLNLYGLMSTDPSELLTHQDPVGSENDATWDMGLRIAKTADAPLFVAAWGAHRMTKLRDRFVLGLVQGLHLRPHCLGMTADGSPRHPLYVSNSAKLNFWSPRGTEEA